MKVIFPHKINTSIEYWLRMGKFHRCGCINHNRIYVKCKRYNERSTILNLFQFT